MNMFLSPSIKRIESPFWIVIVAVAEAETDWTRVSLLPGVAFDVQFHLLTILA